MKRIDEQTVKTLFSLCGCEPAQLVTHNKETNCCCIVAAIALACEINPSTFNLQDLAEASGFDATYLNWLATGWDCPHAQANQVIPEKQYGILDGQMAWRVMNATN